MSAKQTEQAEPAITHERIGGPGRTFGTNDALDGIAELIQPAAALLNGSPIERLPVAERSGD